MESGDRHDRHGLGSPESAGDWNATRAGTPFATLCYESRAKARPSEDDLTELVDYARERNRQFGVTGMLVHQGDRFFQWLEGPGAALEGLWSSIRRDDRHGDIQLLGEGVTQIRLFSDWDLRFFTEAMTTHRRWTARRRRLPSRVTRSTRLALHGSPSWLWRETTLVLKL